MSFHQIWQGSSLPGRIIVKIPGKERCALKLVKRIVTRKKQALIARCESCRREIEIPFSNTINPHSPSIDLKDVIRCECGEIHNLIVDSSSRRPTALRRADNEPLKCPNCGSTQLYAGDKGFGLGKAAAGGILIGPAGLLGGFIGSKKIMITCLNCGHKWQAGKS